MRGLVAAGLLLAFMFSGCSSGTSLQAYLMQPHEAPASCGLLDYDSETGRFLQAQFNWTGNPGRVDNQVFGEDGDTPVNNLVALFECDGEEEGIASIVLEFASANATSEYVDDNRDGECEIDSEWGAEAGITAGNIVAFVEAESDVDGMEESIQRWSQRVSRSAGVPDPCSDGNTPDGS